MNGDDQLKKWLAGEPVHIEKHIVDGVELAGGQCCPDFSCCRPELLASLEERQAYVMADEPRRMEFLMQFLGRAFSGAKIHVVGASRAVKS